MLEKGDRVLSVLDNCEYIVDLAGKYECRIKREGSTNCFSIKTQHLRKLSSEYDNVNSPDHYKLNEHGIECIDAIEASMSREEFMGYCKGNQIKYIWRYRYKGKDLEDLQKAEWYLRRLIKTVKDNENKI